MDIESLKSNWDKSKGNPKQESELEQMTRIKQHPALKKIRLRLLLESVLLVCVLLIYRDWFDGATKPLYINILLGASISLFILNDVLSYLAIKNPVMSGTIKTSVEKHIVTLKRLSVFSLLASAIYSAFLLSFLTSTIHFTTVKYFMLTGIICAMLILLYVSYWQWRKRIRSFSEILEEFTEA
ncbi:hypothetical protein QNI19_22910 [Cytophagaceae bacterium DM2B3-1]|uniref:Uncharacterized protein n=1 Tax=Xanthocytophaga flava TaxID=3048013 RepID=A0ABT7CT38_9BACT|nr:hypothetical protein [Xanthocytophaga flavus]MDJ1495804.1 hypothetical protein [Xanthocytophaga flavus]